MGRLLFSGVEGARCFVRGNLSSSSYLRVRVPVTNSPVTNSFVLDAGCHLAFAKYCVVHESTILLFLPPTCIAHPGAVLLHNYWAVYDFHSGLIFVCHTLYNIGNNNIM